MFNLEDAIAIVKPHNDKIVAEARAAETDRKLEAAREILRDFVREAQQTPQDQHWDDLVKDAEDFLNARY